MANPTTVEGDVVEDVWSLGGQQSPAPATPIDATPATILPPRPGPATPPPVRRPIGQLSTRDVMVVVGAAGSALCTTLLLFGRLTPMSGKLAFVIVGFAIFLATYALLVSMTENRTAVIDRVMSALLCSAAVVAGIALISVVTFTLRKGLDALRRTNLYTQDMSAAGPLDPLSMGGIRHAIVGTLIIITLSLIITVPLALGCAVFLTETRGRFTELVRSVVTAMTALPSIIAGLFIFATWILILGFERSGLAASFAVSLMMLPIIIRSSDVVLRLVPGNLREASAALGAQDWRTVRYVVLPTARSGLATSVILGVARGLGETAPVLLVSGITATVNYNPLEGPMMSLPLATYEFVRSPQPTLVARGFATAAVLMVVVLVLFTIARIAGGRPAGHLSRGQAKRTAARSAKDVARFESHHRAAVGSEEQIDRQGLVEVAT